METEKNILVIYFIVGILIGSIVGFGFGFVSATSACVSSVAYLGNLLVKDTGIVLDKDVIRAGLFSYKNRVADCSNTFHELINGSEVAWG